MTEFLFEFASAHPYLSFAFHFTTLLFVTIWLLAWVVNRKEKTGEKAPDLSVPPSPKEIKQLTEDHDVLLWELNLDEAVLHCKEIAEKNEGTVCGDNHEHLSILLGELNDRRESAKLQEERRRLEATRA